MKKWRILLAVIISTFLTFIVGILSNLAATYLAPAWAENPWIIYIALAVTFPVSLVISSRLFLKTLPDTFSVEHSQPRGDRFPAPKINPLPKKIYGKIAFLREKDNNQEYIIANSDGSDELIVAKSSWSIHNPRIAPGGKQVAFASAHEGKHSIYIVDRNGSNLKRLTGPGRAKSDEYASWSPDGTKLIYFREYSISNDIYVMDSNGNNQKNLTDIFAPGNKISSNLFSEFPWSPNGQRIVFSSNRDGSLKIYIMDKNGGNLRQITNNPETQDYGAVWAPSRNTIAYVSTNVNGETDIFTLNVDSPRAKPVNITKSSCHDTNPVWSPEGTQILFVSNRDGNNELYIMNSDGNNVRRITYTTEAKDNPSWLR